MKSVNRVSISLGNHRNPELAGRQCGGVHSQRRLERLYLRA